MAYVISFTENALKKDVPSIPAANYDSIMRAIHERLTVAPLSFGKQLRYGLKHYRSLRVGEWRIAYRVEGETVIIAHIENRRDAYKR